MDYSSVIDSQNRLVNATFPHKGRLTMREAHQKTIRKSVNKNKFRKILLVLSPAFPCEGRGTA